MVTFYPELPFSALSQLPVSDSAGADALYRKALATFRRKVVVLDDDPTGIQTVHGVNVYTRWDEESVLSGFEEKNGMFFILTNSRSFTSEQTETVHREIAERVCAAARKTGKDFVLISRADSTLRGHWPLETQMLAGTVEKVSGRRYDGEVLMPFFMEGGRYTIGNVHYVRDGNRLIPAGQTEFAKDSTFGYVSSDLCQWCEEKTGGKFQVSDCVCIPLEELRALDTEAVFRRLMGVKNFGKVIVNAACYDDVKVFCAAFLRALAEGKEFLFRTAAAWTKILGGVEDRSLLSRSELVSGSGAGGVILVGSHVHKTTLQLEDLRSSGLPVTFIEFDATQVSVPGGLEREVERTVALTEREIEAGRTAAVYTTRKRIDFSELEPEQRLLQSVAISDAVTSIVGKLRVQPSFIVAKGGITSSDVGTKALGVRKAEVLGQIMPGIPVWKTGPESKFPGMSYVIFPGNVGETTTLTAAVRVLLG